MNFASSIPRALAAAALWAAVDAFRARHGVPIVVGFCALFGSTSLLFGLLVVGVRTARPLGDVARAMLAGAAMSALPLLAVAAVLQKTTHHRALGGVTFAFVALVLVGACVACAARLLQIAHGGGAAARIARGALAVLVVPAVAVIATLLVALRAPAALSLVPALVDAAIGIALLAVAMVAPALSARTVPARVGVAAWLAVVAMGCVVSATSPPSRAALSEETPVAFVLGAGWGG